MGFFETGLMHKTKNVYVLKRNGEEVYKIEWEGDLVSLYHYGTKLITLDASSGKIVYGTDITLSLSDSMAIGNLIWIFKRIYGKEVEDYEIYHRKFYYGERREKKAEQLFKFRKGILNHLNSLPDAIPILQKLGFEVNLISYERGSKEDTFFRHDYQIPYRDADCHSWFIRPNKLFFRVCDMENTKLKVTHMFRKLNNVQIVKTVMYSPKRIEKSIYDKAFELKDVRVSGIDESGQLWSLRAPLGYYLASIQACERWFLGIRKEDEVVLEQ